MKMTIRKSKPKSSLLNHRATSQITKLKRTPKTLKPLRARQLIRRFHILIKYKSQLLTKLETTEDEYMAYINKDKKLFKKYQSCYDEVMKTLEINKTPSTEITSNINDIPNIVSTIGAIDAEIEKRGGLETYQRASTLGQDGKRGGDSSKLLMEWLKDLQWEGNDALELGCLSCKNAISTSGHFQSVQRIDLNSQEPGILQQDFLKRPLPANDNEKFDLISCSLVLNFVPSNESRGEMIKLFPKFLRKKDNLVFLVLPLPCVENSRYMTQELLLDILKSLGLNAIKQKKTHKLYYALLQWSGTVSTGYHCKKQQLRTGSNRNNFFITL